MRIVRNLALLLCLLAGAGPVWSAPTPHLARARARLADGELSEAQAAFEAHIASLPARQQRLYTDPATVAGREVRDLLARLPEAEADAARRRFWKALDPTPITPANERLLEHYRRVAYALAHYARPDGGVDRRGEVYVRYGPPDHVSRWDDIQIEQDRDIQNARIAFADRARMGFQIPPGQPIFPVRGTDRWEYWVYRDLEGGVEISFVKNFGSRGYDYPTMPAGLSVQVVSELSKLDPGAVVEKAVARHPSVYRPDFADLALDFHYYTAGFRGEAGTGRLEIYYGLPASEVARLNVDAGSDLILLDRGVALYDSVWAEAYRTVDQLAFQAPSDREIHSGAFIPGVLSVDLPPGPYRMALQVRDALSGQSRVYREDVVLEDFHSNGGLQLSDVELAFLVAPADSADGDEYTKHGLRVVPMSSRTFRADQSAFVYFEIYGLSRDAFGQTRYRLAYDIRAERKRSAPARVLHGLGRLLNLAEDDRQVSIAFEQTGTRPDEVTYVELDLSEANEGDQRVRIEVTDLVAGRSADREIAFSVVPAR